MDLVFLVDSSASVGSQNFYNEIKFIRKVLYFSESLQVQLLLQLINLQYLIKHIFTVACRFYGFHQHHKGRCYYLQFCRQGHKTGNINITY